MKRLLVSIDIGGTLGRIDGPSLTTILTEASPLEPAEVRRIMRQMLYVRPTISPGVVADVCNALRIPLDAFPRDVKPLPLRLEARTLASLRLMSQHAALVTLSNVTCLEASTDQLRGLLHPWVQDYFPSCRIGYAKPDPDAWHYVARTCLANTAQMVHIGDDWTCDVQGARSAGVTAIWVSNGRPVPAPEWIADSDVIVATDLPSASRQIINIADRR